MYESVYTGNGEVCLAPPLLGDIAAITLDGSQQWSIGKNAFLAATIDIHKKTKSQGIGKALFSGEDLFVYQLTGNGIIWVSAGVVYAHAVIPSQLVANFEYLIDSSRSPHSAQSQEET